jgi:hypothetical protein
MIYVYIYIYYGSGISRHVELQQKARQMQVLVASFDEIVLIFLVSSVGTETTRGKSIYCESRYSFPVGF